MDNMVWKNWAPPKCKLFSWLIIQNRVWTADRLERRGWPNGRLCPLCCCEDETARHLLFTCRFSIRLWGMIKNWLNIGDFNPPGLGGLQRRAILVEAPRHRKWEKEEGDPVTTHACDLGNLERAQLTDFQALEHTSELNFC